MSIAQQIFTGTAQHRPDPGGTFGLPGGSAEDLIAILASLQDQLDDLTATVRRQQQAIDRLSAAAPAGDR
jgi:hypothetical protein